MSRTRRQPPVRNGEYDDKGLPGTGSGWFEDHYVKDRSVKRRYKLKAKREIRKEMERYHVDS